MVVKEQKERDALKEKLKLANVMESPSRQEAIEILLKFLFPYWKYSPIYTNAANQGFSKIDPTDYWERMVREKLDDEEISDQEVARAIINWKENKDDLPVYKNLRLTQAVNEIIGFPDKLKQLGELLLDTEQVHKLTSQLFQIVFREKGLKDENFPGSNELHKLMSSIELKRSFSSKEDLVSPFNHFTWLVEEVNKLFPYSLLIAAEFIITGSYGVRLIPATQKIIILLIVPCSKKQNHATLITIPSLTLLKPMTMPLVSSYVHY